MLTNSSAAKGFTLIEIMVAVAILAILAAIAIPNFMSYRKESHDKACRENKEIILHACTLCEINQNTIITEMSKLCAESQPGGLRREPHCPIGGEYKISHDAATGFTVSCTKDDEHESE